MCCYNVNELISGEIDSIKVELVTFDDGRDSLELIVDGKSYCRIPSDSDHYVYNDDELVQYFQDGRLDYVELCGNKLYFMYNENVTNSYGYMPTSIQVNSRCLVLPLVWEA